MSYPILVCVFGVFLAVFKCQQKGYPAVFTHYYHFLLLDNFNDTWFLCKLIQSKIV